ncbi:MAG: hypothetical protein ACYDCG_00295 [Candidatus Acidiferrales bacterium]
MQAANQSAIPSESSRANGQTHLHDLFVLTDEQILEIEPDAQDVSLREDVVQREIPAAVTSDAGENELANPNQAGPRTQSAQAGVPGLPEPPAWLAETMNDPLRGADARALWEGAQRAEKEAASYREVFAKPEEARTAAERARVLDDIDRAFFAGDAVQRAQLAAMMMREDPSAFREMVFEGLRALEEAGHTVRTRSVADAVNRSAGPAQPGGASPATTAQASNHAQQRVDSGQHLNNAAQQAQLAAYAAFEKAANDDLERSVGGAIERTLEQALPAAGKADGAALKGRMAAAIRQDVEKALQGDRQLGEQVAQILSAKRLDNETRAQIVRLIGERAQQLVPGATKRALNDWTQTTLAAHRGKSARADAASARRELTPAATGPRDSQAHGAKQKDAPRAPRIESVPASKGRVDYRKLSDDQILDL